MANTDIWEYVKSLPGNEDIRARHCRGCKYLGCCGHWVCCNYILETDKQRPGKFGQPNCPVRKNICGYTPSEEYLQWVGEMDNRLRQEEETSKQKETDNVTACRSGPRRNGRSLTWDAEYARRLYCRGYYLREIAEIMGVPHHRVADASYQQMWKAGRTNVELVRHGDLEEEKRAFKEYMEKEGNEKIHKYNTERIRYALK